MSSQPVDPRSRPSRGTGTLLVTGATGFVGVHLCRRLGQSRARFRALIRRSSNRRLLDGTGAWLIEGDLGRPESLGPAVEGASAIVHLAGLTGSGTRQQFREANVEGTAHLLEAARAAGVRRVVALSSAAALAQAPSDYGQSKASAEELLSEEARRGEIEVVVLRPPLILGRGSPHLQQLRTLARLPVQPFPESLEQRPVGVGDVCKAIFASLELTSEELPGEPIDLPGAEALSLADLVAAVAQAQGWSRPRTLPGARSLLRLAGRLPGSAGQRIHTLLQGASQDESLARHVLNWSPVAVAEILGHSTSSDQNPT